MSKVKETLKEDFTNDGKEKILEKDKIIENKEEAQESVKQENDNIEQGDEIVDIKEKEQNEEIIGEIEQISKEEHIEVIEDKEQEYKEVEDEISKDNKEKSTIQIRKEKKLETSTILEENIIKEQENNDETSGINEEKKVDFLHKYAIAITIISALLFIGLVVFSTIFGLINRSSNKIVNGVYINKIEVSGLTYEEAKQKLTKIYENKISQSITLKYNEYYNEFNFEEIEAKLRIEEALNIAYSIGRSGKVLKDNYAIINAYIGKLNITPAFSYNEEKLTKIINETDENIPNKVLNTSYIIENDKLIVTKGKSGNTVKKDELKNLILNNITNLKLEEQQIDIPVVIQQPDNIDIEKIHTEIYKEPKDAYYQKDPFTIYPHVIGVDFNISLEEAKSLSSNNNEDTITIPLKMTIPNITTNQIGTEAFPDLLATYTTSFSTSNFNRTTNIKLSSNKINGVVLMPGEEFSYNKVVGQRTAAKGYKSAPVYVGGKVVNDIGGGICQVSSTLYNTALRANLEIVKRSNHRFATGYVPLSTDATVSWGGPEFIFKNSRKYPIKIVSTVTGGKIKVDIYGCKEETEYEVIIQSIRLQTIPMKTEYRINTSLPTGTTKTVQKGHPGYKSSAYRILKLNGSVISKQLLSTDTYAQLPTIIEKN